MNYETAHELFKYNPETGDLNRRTRVPGSQIKIGEAVGYADCRGAMTVRVDNKLLRVHRLVWLMVHGEWPGEIDHIDGNPSNNRLENLRVVTHQENGMNQKMRKNNSSGAMGVWWDKSRKKWGSSITVKYKTINLGRHDSLLDAVCARKAAEVEHGYHRNHGRII